MDLVRRFTDRTFWAILIMCLFGSIVFIANAVLNVKVVQLEQEYNNGLPIEWLCFLSVLVSLLLAVMVYNPIKCDKTTIVLVALVLYQVAYIWWSTTLFHNKTNRSTAMLTGMGVIVAVLWLGWCSYNLDKNTIYFTLVVLAWALYLENYTFNIEAHPWVSG